MTPNREASLRAYIVVFRVKTADTLLLTQPYHPMLFQQGPRAGPYLLLEFLRGHLEENELQAR